jgi:hypothetical protein
LVCFYVQKFIDDCLRTDTHLHQKYAETLCFIFALQLLMQKNPPKNIQVQRTVLSLVSGKTLSHFETAFRGCLVRQCHSLDALKVQLKANQRALILLEFEHCTARHIEAFLSLVPKSVKGPSKIQMRMIIIAKSMEMAAFQKYARHPDLLLILKSDIVKAYYLTSKFLQGDPVYMRSAVRQATSSPVVVKSTNWISPENLSQRKGRFLDFAKQGARLYLPQRTFKTKDYVSVLYQLENQGWITVECQLRWEEATADGGQMIGVQFLAIA